MFIRRTSPQQQQEQTLVTGKEPMDGQRAGDRLEVRPRLTIPKDEVSWEDASPIGDRPRLSKDERELVLRLRGKVHQRVVSDFERGFAKGIDMQNSQQVRPLVERVAQEVMESEQVSLPSKLREVLVQEVLDEIIGYGPLQAFLDDPTITEIMVNSADKIFTRERVAST
jgi:hypothetical protein